MKNLAFFFCCFTGSLFGQFKCLHNHDFCGHHIPALTARSVNPIKFAYCDPPVIFKDEHFNIHFKIDQNNVDSIEVTGNWFHDVLSVPPPTPIPLTKFTLVDDGLLGDKVAKDKVFTYSKKIYVTDYTDIKHSHLNKADLKFYYKNGTTEKFSSVNLNFGIRVTPKRYKAPKVKILNDSVQVTDYLINIVTKNADYTPEIIKKYYQYLPDDRDFLANISTYGSLDHVNQAAAYYEGVQNKIQGLHSVAAPVIFDNTGLYNSKGRLQGLIPVLRTYSCENSLISHELLHRWGMYSNPTLGLSLSAHYGFVFIPGSSLFGGTSPNKLTVLTDSTLSISYGLADNSANKFELYLMGLIPIDSVDFPFTVFNGGKFLNGVPFTSEYPNGVNTFKYTNLTQVTKTMFISSAGPRIPTVANSQKEFNMGFIITSHRLLSSEELSYFHNKIREYEEKTHNPNINKYGNNNFNVSLAGKATLSTKLPVDIPKNDLDGDGFDEDLDCNDNNPAINPGATEICDGIDNNCDGLIDNGLPLFTYYLDNDKDGYGNLSNSITTCKTLAPSSYVNNSLDCNDDNDRAYPGATEVCDGIDNNCNGLKDEGLPLFTYYQDKDKDGFGNGEISLATCFNFPPVGYVVNALDCNDNNSLIHPNATEIPNNGIDENCDGKDYLTTSTIDNNSSNLIIIFPNPSKNMLTIRSDKKVDVSIFNTYGKLITQIVISEDEIQLDIFDWPSGLYLLFSSSGEVHKFIKL